eukprot:20277_1
MFNIRGSYSLSQLERDIQTVKKLKTNPKPIMKYVKGLHRDTTGNRFMADDKPQAIMALRNLFWKRQNDDYQFTPLIEYLPADGLSEVVRNIGDTHVDKYIFEGCHDPILSCYPRNDLIALLSAHYSDNFAHYILNKFDPYLECPLKERMCFLECVSTDVVVTIYDQQKHLHPKELLCFFRKMIQSRNVNKYVSILPAIVSAICILGIKRLTLDELYFIYQNKLFPVDMDIKMFIGELTRKNAKIVEDLNENKRLTEKYRNRINRCIDSASPRHEMVNKLRNHTASFKNQHEKLIAANPHQALNKTLQTALTIIRTDMHRTQSSNADDTKQQDEINRLKSENDEYKQMKKEFAAQTDKNRVLETALEKWKKRLKDQKQVCDVRLRQMEDKNKAEIATLKRKEANAQTGLTEARKKNHALEIELKKYKKSLSDQQQYYENLLREINSYENTLFKKNKELTKSQENIRSLQVRNGSLSNQVRSLSDELGGVRAEYETIFAQNREKMAALSIANDKLKDDEKEHELAIQQSKKANYTLKRKQFTGYNNNIDANKPITLMDNPLVMFFGVSKYLCKGHKVYKDLHDIGQDERHFRETFVTQFGYGFVSNRYKDKIWKKEEALDWIQRQRDEVLLKNGRAQYNGLIFCGASHGSMHSIICSDGTSLDVTVIRSIFGPMAKRIFRYLPKIFIFNCCRTPYAKDARGPSESTGTAGYGMTITGCEGNPVFGATLSSFVADAFSKGNKQKLYDIYRNAKAKAQHTMGLTLQEHDTDVDDVVFMKRVSRGSERSAQVDGTGQYGDDALQNILEPRGGSIDLSEYLNALRDAGFTNKKMIRTLTSDKLQEHKIKMKVFHKKELLKRIADLSQ